jgi:type I restriction enzyme, R subunit
MQTPEAPEVEVKIIYRLRRHAGDPRFVELGERLEQLRERYLRGQFTSIEFLKHLLELAKDVVQSERELVAEQEVDRGRGGTDKAQLPSISQEAASRTGFL